VTETKTERTKETAAAVGVPREPLTRQRIVRAALELMDREGLEAVSMRRIGRELGVEAMSLYNHVQDKDDILEGIKELVMSEFEMGAPTGDWEQDARLAARAWRDVLRAHPKVITLMTEATRPMFSPDALRPSETAFEIFERAGLGDAETARAFCAFGGYIMGFVLMEVGTMIGGGAQPGASASPEELAMALPVELPRACRVFPYVLAADPDERFEYGLDLMIAGLKAKLTGS
jgi:AcrR family transcriptional regulator